jgi:cytochrome b-561 domain-containing protein 2
VAYLAMEKIELKTEEKNISGTWWQKIEIFLNTVNHGLIAVTTFYLIWYCMHYQMFDLLNVHAWMTTIGYQLLMAEGIMSFYKANSFTFLSSRSEKTCIHWILEAVGGFMGLAGCIVYIYKREIDGKRHFKGAHSLYGERKM